MTSQQPIADQDDSDMVDMRDPQISVNIDICVWTGKVILSITKREKTKDGEEVDRTIYAYFDYDTLKEKVTSHDGRGACVVPNLSGGQYLMQFYSSTISHTLDPEIPFLNFKLYHGIQMLSALVSRKKWESRCKEIEQEYKEYDSIDLQAVA